MTDPTTITICVNCDGDATAFVGDSVVILDPDTTANILAAVGADDD